MFHSFLRREILFDYEQYEYHGTSVSRQFLNTFFLFTCSVIIPEYKCFHACLFVRLQ